MKIPLRPCGPSCKITQIIHRRRSPNAGSTGSSKRARLRATKSFNLPAQPRFSACGKERGWALRPSPRKYGHVSTRLEIEAQRELDEARRVVLRVQTSKVSAADIRVRIAEHHVIERVGHLAIESRTDPLRDFCGFRDTEVHVPAAQAAEIAAARATVNRRIGWSEEREPTECVVLDVWGIRICRQHAFVVVHCSALVLAIQGKVSTAVPEDGPLA